MLKILVIENGSQWTHRIYRTLRDLNAEAKIIPNTTPLAEVLNADGLVLSGGALRIGLGEEEMAGNCGKYLDEFSGSILGVCVGQQFIGLHFGGRVGPARTPEFGNVELIIDDHDDLFQGLPDKFTVWASHNDEVSTLPPNFVRLAHSKDAVNQAFKHKTRPIYGTLYHPEVQHSQYGSEVYANFLKTIKK